MNDLNSTCNSEFLESARSKMAATANILSKHKNDHNSGSVTDVELRFADNFLESSLIHHKSHKLRFVDAY